MNFDEACRRAGGRRRYNTTRQVQAAVRRGEVIKLLSESGRIYGVQAEIARKLGVSEATVSRDVRHLMTLHKHCPRCGSLVANC